MGQHQFCDLPGELFPIQVYIYDVTDLMLAEPVWTSALLTGPAAIHIPVFGRPVNVKIVFGNGTCQVASRDNAPIII